MTLTQPFTLSSDVLLIKVGDLPERARLEIGDEGAYAVTRARGRSPSILIDESSAELLEEFRSLSTIADAVLRFSRRRHLDPEVTLAGSYPALRRFLVGGYLVGTGSLQNMRREVVFAPGERVASGMVVRCVRALDDTEFYQLALDDGGLAGLKVLKASTPAAAALLEREAAVLKLLDGRVSPRFLSEGTWNGNLWLSMEWCDGVPVGSAAATLRAGGGGYPALLELCRQVVEAYVVIHEAGIVHGDVHPGNLLASAHSGVRVIDFGLSRIAGSAGEGPRRGGLPPYYDPQYAEAILNGQAMPDASFLSDQYSLGAVLYLLLTGSDYSDFSINREEMLRQAIGARPLPFTRRGSPPWPEMEQLLIRALEKDPAGRFPSVNALRGEMDKLPSSRGTKVSKKAASPDALELLLREVVAKASPGGEWFEQGVPQAPYCSVAYGAAGIAAALLRVGTLRSDPLLVALADEWAVRAEREAGRPEAFSSAAMELDERRTGLTTPYHRRSGVAAVQALIGFAVCDVPASRRAIEAFVRECSQPCDNIDVTLGRAGTVLGAAMLLEAARGTQDTATGALAELGHTTLAGIWDEVDAMPAIADGPLNRLGVAHGWAGLLLTVLRWFRATGAPLPATVPERLDQLAGLAIPKGLGARWPWVVTSPGGVGARTMPGWCNGTAGFVHLWTTAYAVLGEDRWAVLAERAAWDTYTTHTKVAQLCCGAAGQSYALLEMYRHSGENRWLTAAVEVAMRSATLAGTRRSDLIAGSLHKGEVGIAVLAADLAEPEAAVMPFFGSDA